MVVAAVNNFDRTGQLARTIDRLDRTIIELELELADLRDFETLTGRLLELWDHDVKGVVLFGDADRIDELHEIVAEMRQRYTEEPVLRFEALIEAIAIYVMRTHEVAQYHHTRSGFRRLSNQSRMIANQARAVLAGIKGAKR